MDYIEPVIWLKSKIVIKIRVPSPVDKNIRPDLIPLIKVSKPVGTILKKIRHCNL